MDRLCQHLKAIILTSPAINEVNADVEISIEPCTHKLVTIALETSWHFTTRKVLEQIYPNFSSDPGPLIQNITQVSKNEKGVLVTLSVAEYHSTV